MSDRRWWARLARLGIAALGVAALVTLPLQQFDDPGFSLGNFFSYFTILSNAVAVVVLLVGAIAAPTGAAWQWVRGATTTAMVITAIVYALLLSGIDVNLHIDWVNGVLHRVVPLYLLVDWAVFRPRRLPRRSWLSWLTVPLVYGVYTLIRGPIVNWYPYPFLDPRAQGYLEMTLSVVMVFAGMAALAGGVFWLGTRRAA
ncbi:Pr6Pr family membrane protein [Gordonia sp. CPCC 205515]|uniref:Pr6Pr family membrane protein n=1 Tax=Gordonia sp. CPCC 205515 TaxID=3140791 RepID=UPI003AF35ABD